MNLVRLCLLDAYAECGMDAELRELLRAMLLAEQLPLRGPLAAPCRRMEWKLRLRLLNPKLPRLPSRGGDA